MAHNRKIKLNNGIGIPIVGSGAYAPSDPESQSAAKDWILTALKAGYRHIDAAFDYGTENVVGQAIKESGIPREEIFVTTKMSWSHHDMVKESFETSLSNLGEDKVGYINLWLMHWPQFVLYKDGKPVIDEDGRWIVRDDVSFNESYKEMEKIYEDELSATGRKRVRAIGVSNFSIKTLEKLFTTAKIVPAVNQVEVHPYLAQNELIAYCKQKGIAVAAYAPSGYNIIRSDPIINEIAKKYNVTPTQIIFSWHLSRDVIIVPKSSNVERQKENITLITLAKEDLERIDKLDRNERICNKADSNGTVYGWSYEQFGW